MVYSGLLRAEMFLGTLLASHRAIFVLIRHTQLEFLALEECNSQVGNLLHMSDYAASYCLD